MKERYWIKPGSKVELKDFATDDCGGMSKKDARKILKADKKKLRELQAKLYASKKHALLIVLQAMDTGGKDGTIKHVMSGINPQGCTITNFKVPTPEEMAHDYLWRVHKAVPGKGKIGIFNRSQYEDVLVVRVHNLVPPEIWGQRYDQINAFEHLLSENGVRIIKFFLHISKAEQKRRLQARIDEPHKQWKFSSGDLKERAFWDHYMEAYETVLNRCSTPWAPWYIIPADHKWYRNLAVARIIAQTMEEMDLHYPAPEPDLDKVVIED